MEAHTRTRTHTYTHTHKHMHTHTCMHTCVRLNYDNFKKSVGLSIQLFYDTDPHGS